jgi:hypothetical protein
MPTGSGSWHDIARSGQDVVRSAGMRSLGRLARLLAIAVLLAGVSVGTLGQADVRAATPDLTLVTEARYEVLPADRKVHVSVVIHAANHRRDTTTKRYYFDQAYLAVLPGTSSYTISASGAKPKVSVSRRTNAYTLLKIAFGTKVYSGKQLDLRLAFDLKDPGGAPGREVRVGTALVSFPVWAFASNDTPGSRVEVVLPDDYHVEFAAGSMPEPTTADGAATYRTGALSQPLSFFAYVVADRPGAYAETTLVPTVGGRPAPITLQAWTDDAGWAKRIGKVIETGLPALGDGIGLPYPRIEPVTVQESISRTLGGYAGLFDPSEGRIQIDYGATSFVALHEAAHLWFNGQLLADRWANEAFASYYAGRVVAAKKLDGSPDRLTPEVEKSKIPLNAWGVVGGQDDATESYGYAAGVALAEAIGERAGDAGLRATWAAAEERRSAYQPTRPGAPVETTDGAPDWRGLLDLLETETGRSFDDLWREWVARPQDLPLLQQRAVARTEYDAVVAAARDWELPASIRSAMTTWNFDEAIGQLAQANGVLGLRDQIAREAAAADLTPPPTLRDSFEGDAGLRAADVEGRAELAAIATIAAAQATQPPDGPLEQLGLVGATPLEDMAAARAAFAAGDLSTAVDKAEAARAAWDSADDVGLRRALSIGGVALLVALLVTLTAAGVRRRRRERAAATAAAMAGSDGTALG